MSNFAKDGGKRPSAAPAQIAAGVFFWSEVSMFGEITEENDCILATP
jgi:hypothetical protein